MRSDVKSKTMWSKPFLKFEILNLFFFKNRSDCTIQFGLGLCVEISFGQLWMRQRSRWHGDITGQRDPRSVVAQLHQWRHSCHAPFMSHQLQWLEIWIVFGMFREHDLKCHIMAGVLWRENDWSWGHPSKNSLVSIEMLPWLGIVVLLAEAY